jgi:hypothetical protein
MPEANVVLSEMVLDEVKEVIDFSTTARAGVVSDTLEAAVTSFVAGLAACYSGKKRKHKIKLWRISSITFTVPSLQNHVMS